MIRRLSFYAILVIPILGASALDCWCQVEKNLGFRLPPGVEKANVPFELINNLVVLKVIVNNTLPLKFILDTGIRTAILTEKTFTDILNVNYSRIITVPGAGGEKLVDAYIASDIELDVGGVIGRGHALLVLERDLLQLKNFLGHNIQGILGYELFSRFIVELNYNKKVMTLYEPNAFEKRFRGMKKYTAIPLTVEDTKPYCNMVVHFTDGTSFNVKMMMDTGASMSFFLDPASSDAIVVPEKSIRSNLGRGLGGDIDGEIGRVYSVELDKFQFKDVVVGFPDKQSYSLASGAIGRNGSMGGEVFSRFRVIFNFMDGYMYLKKNSKYKRPFDYNMSGLIVKAEGLYLNTFKIVYVRPDSEAEKQDIREGDQILSINGRSAEDLKLDRIYGYFTSRQNKTIRFEILRNGEILFKKMKLTRII